MSDVFTPTVLNKKVTYTWAELNDASRRMQGLLREEPRPTYSGPSAGQVRTLPQSARRDAQLERAVPRNPVMPKVQAEAEDPTQLAMAREELIADLVNSVTPLITERVSSQVGAILEQSISNALTRVKADVSRSIEATVHGVVRQAVQTAVRTGRLR